MASMGCLHPKNTLSGLATELHSRILFFAVKVDDAIRPIDLGEDSRWRKYLRPADDPKTFKFINTVTGRPIQDPTTSLMGIHPLHQIANREFYWNNTFRVHTQLDRERFSEVVRQDQDWPLPVSLKLKDDPGLRPHIHNLQLDMDRADCLTGQDDGAESIQVLSQLPALYPKLRSLTVVVQSLILPGDTLGTRAVKTIAHARLDFLLRLTQALKDMPGLKNRYVDLKHVCSIKGKMRVPRTPVELDGRDKDVHQLCWEMLDLRYAKARL